MSSPNLVLQFAPCTSKREHLWTAYDLPLPWGLSQSCDILFHDHNTSPHQKHVTYPTSWLIRMCTHEINYHFNTFQNNASSILPKANFFFPSHLSHCSVNEMHCNTCSSLPVTIPTDNILHMLVYCTLQYLCQYTLSTGPASGVTSHFDTFSSDPSYPCECVAKILIVHTFSSQLLPHAGNCPSLIFVLLNIGGEWSDQHVSPPKDLHLL